MASTIRCPWRKGLAIKEKLCLQTQADPVVVRECRAAACPHMVSDPAERLASLRPTCRVTGCGQPAYAKGFCPKHYRAAHYRLKTDAQLTSSLSAEGPQAGCTVAAQAATSAATSVKTFTCKGIAELARK